MPAHFTPEHQRKARAAVSSESCARNGRLGALATIRKHGFECFFKGWRAWKLQHPSRPELLIIGILSTLKINSEREWQIPGSFLTLDFYLSEFHKAIEVHGRIHSTLKKQQREENDARKRELLKQLGIECLWVEESELRDVMSLAAKIQRFVKRT
jgi:very-short-patch-repair endonuclease